MSDTVLKTPEHTVQTAFTRAQLDWLPWLEPLAVEAMSARHMASLVDAGVTADLGERWNAIVAASVALTATPSAFGPEHVDRLRGAGLDDLAISDVIHAAAFFNWANRLMLSLGEPAAPAGS